MTPSTVSPTPQPGASGAPAPAAAPGQAPAQPAAPDAAALQKQIDTLTAQAAELTRTAEFWHGKANAAPPPKETKPEPEEEPGVDILELAMDPKKFNKYLEGQIKKQGYVRREDAEKLVNGKAAQLTREASLMKKYPDLEDHDSEMFKTTAGRYGELVKQGVAEGIAMEMAAESAELALIRSGKVKTPAQKAADKEAYRLARVAAQGGDRGGRGSGDDETDTTLNEHERRAILGIMRGEVDDKGQPFSDEQLIERYTHRAQKIGVAMTPRSTRKAA